MMNDPVLFGLSEVKFIHTPQIFTSRSVRLRCQYLCSMTHQSPTSPPLTPTSNEAREIFDEYRYGVIVRKEEPFGVRDCRAVWKDFSDTMLGIEADAWTRGYSRAFAVAIGNCLYLHHDDRFRPCDYPTKSRPTLEALGVEMRDTLEMVHWEDYLNREASDPFQLFGLLLLD